MPPTRTGLGLLRIAAATIMLRWPDSSLWLIQVCPTVSLGTRTTMHSCRAHYPGGSKRLHMSIASPSHAAFPKLWVGRHPHCPFRGLLRLHSRYRPHACSTAQGGLCHGASTEPVARLRRPLATSAIDNSLGGTLLHKCFAQSRRTRDSDISRSKNMGPL